MRLWQTFQTVLVCSLMLPATQANAQQAESEGDRGTGGALVELKALVLCAEGRPDAVDRALQETLQSADLIPSEAAKMKAEARAAHAKLVARGGCSSFPSERLEGIRERAAEIDAGIRASGGEMELDLPTSLGGTSTGRASYGTVAVGSVAYSALCLEAIGEGGRATDILLLSRSEVLFREGSHDLGKLNAMSRLRVSGVKHDIKYGMLGIHVRDRDLLKGSFYAFLTQGSEMIRASFTAVPAADPCGIKNEISG